MKKDAFFTGFILWTAIFVFLFIMAFAKDEGTSGDGLVLNFFADSFFIVFPITHLLVLIHGIHPLILLLCLLGNIILYAFLTRGLFIKWFKNIKGYMPYNGSFYAINGLMLILLAYFLILIYRAV